MKKIIALLLPLFAVACAGQTERTMKLHVEQTVRIPVGYVTVSSGIYERGKEAATVENEGYAKLSRVVDVLKSMGYSRQHLEINSGEVNHRGYGDNEYYTSNSSITFDLKELDKLDTIRRNLTRAGANRFRIDSYSNAEEDSIFDAAYRSSIDKARRKAQRLLTDQNVRIGKILNMNERVEDLVKVSATQQEEAPAIKLRDDASFIQVDPLFHKKYYNRRIEFVIEFALEDG